VSPLLNRFRNHGRWTNTTIAIERKCKRTIYGSSKSLVVVPSDMNSLEVATLNGAGDAGKYLFSSRDGVRAHHAGWRQCTRPCSDLPLHPAARLRDSVRN